MKKILITGITGFLGSHLAKALLENNYEVVALKRPTSSLNRIKCILSDVNFIDISDNNFNKIFEKSGKIDAIIHTATCYGRNNESVIDIFAANTEFPLKLLESGSRAKIDLFINTDTILDKYLNLYSLSKNQLLQWGKFFSKNEKIRFANLRLEHFYGPEDDQSKFTSFIISNCKNNTPELNLTNGEQMRDFIHIDDVVSAYLTFLNKSNSFSEKFIEFDVGSGSAISIRQFVETVHRLTKSNTRLNFGALPYRLGEVMYSKADISTLSSMGWNCRFNIEDGLKLSI
jgi:CDP-paratose synthetase